MIPTVADDATHARYIANIIAVYRTATVDQEFRGRNWYRTAHELAYKMSGADEAPTKEDAERLTRAAAGVIAALSPQKAWYLNVKLAMGAFATGEVRGQVHNAVAKADKIMRGAHPLDVLPDDSKTWHFYRSIIDPTDPDPVVVDRHAHDIAVGEVYGSADRGLSNKNRYATIAHAYREAARQLGIIPSVLQAVTWVVQVDATADLPYRGGRSPKN